MRVVRVLTAIVFSAIVGAYLLSLFGVLFVSGRAWLVGLAAFLGTFGTFFFRKGAWFARRPFVWPSLWRVLGPLFVVLFFVSVLLSLGLGAPELGDAPVLASREQYPFSRGTEVPRWRFVLVGLASHLAWHLLGIGFTLENWRGVIHERGPGKVGVGSAPPSGLSLLRQHLRRLRTLAKGARRGRLSLTHVKRIRRFVYFAITSEPIFYCIAAVFVVLFALVGAGLLPFRAPILVIALEFAALWVGFALDLIIAAWERDLPTALWMLLWVVAWGWVAQGVLRFVVSGA